MKVEVAVFWYMGDGKQLIKFAWPYVCLHNENFSLGSTLNGFST